MFVHEMLQLVRSVSGCDMVKIEDVSGTRESDGKELLERVRIAHVKDKSRPEFHPEWIRLTPCQIETVQERQRTQ